MTENRDIYQEIADKCGVTRAYVKTHAVSVMYTQGTLEDKIKLLEDLVNMCKSLENEDDARKTR